jgi:hypothetical protein
MTGTLLFERWARIDKIMAHLAPEPAFLHIVVWGRAPALTTFDMLTVLKTCIVRTTVVFLLLLIAPSPGMAA